MRYFRILAYVDEIHLLLYDACTNWKKSANTYVFALNVPYCICGTQNLTEKRCVYWVFCCDTLNYTIPVACLHYHVISSFMSIQGTFLEFYCMIILAIEDSLFFMRMLEFFYICYNRVGFICSTSTVLFMMFCILYFLVTNYFIITFAITIWSCIVVCDYRGSNTQTIGIYYGASTKSWNRSTYHSYYVSYLGGRSLLLAK